MRFYKVLLSTLFSIHLFSLQGLSAVEDNKPQDCLLFQEPDLKGNALKAKVELSDVSQSSLPEDFNDKISSLWVRDGYVLEVYKDANFLPAVLSSTSWSAVGSRQSEGDTQNGTSINLLQNAPDFDGQISSFRCRIEGTTVEAFQNGKVNWFEGKKFSWRSDGSHPDHIWIEMTSDPTSSEPVVTIHEDTIYDSSRRDFVVNLKTGKVHALYSEGGYVKGKVEFDLFLAARRPEFRIMISDLARIIETIANKPQFVFGTATPPPVELNSLRDWLLAMYY